jgi:hypothetical protein
MRLLSTDEMIRIWEEGRGCRPVDRAVLFLSAAFPEVSSDGFVEMSIGQRDARLFALREQTFGQVLRCYIECPHCADPLEFDTTVAEIQQATAEIGHEKLGLDMLEEDFMLRMRLPNSLDVAAVIACADDAMAHRLLIERCVLQSVRDGEPVPFNKLPDTVVTQLVTRMAELDPMADLQLALTCPACSHSWVLIFDIVSFFLSEIDRWSRGILRDVHTLASAYGWREADILAMRSWRRQAYMEMVCE